MDDELPLLIFMVVRDSNEFFASEIGLLLDYTKATGVLEAEHRLITNFDASIAYILNDWD